MFKFDIIIRNLTAAVGAILLTSVTVGAAFGPAQAVEAAPALAAQSVLQGAGAANA